MKYETIADWNESHDMARRGKAAQTCARCGVTDAFVTATTEEGIKHFWCVRFGEGYDDPTEADWHLTKEQRELFGEGMAMQFSQYLADMQKRINYLQWKLERKP